MDLLLEGKVFLITGGASGIGEATVGAVAAEQAIPVILDRKPRESASSILEAIGESLLQPLPGDPYVEIDLCNESEIAAAVVSVAGTFGRIDGVVNNAGLNDGVGLDADRTAFEESLRKNLVHCFDLVREALPHLKKSRGSVINIGSKTYRTGQGGTSGYVAAKGGLAALTREWALELAGDGIRCNAVIPAEVWTPMYEYWLSSQKDPDERKRSIESRIPLGRRMTTPSEIAAMIVFLLSEKSSHTTGQIIHVDGGYVHLDRAYS